MAEIKQVFLNEQTYDIAAKYVLDGSNLKTWEDIEALVSKAGRVVVLDTLPAADATAYETYKDALVLVPKSEGGSGNVKDEYVIVRSGTEGAYTYAWEKIGDTEIDLSDYLKKNVLYADAALEDGAHTHTVSGTVEVPTVSKTDSKLSASADKPEVTPQSSKAISGFGEHTSETFVKSYPGVSQNLVQDTVVPAVSNGTVTPAVDLESGSRPTKTVFGDNTTASKVTVTPGEAATFTQGTQAELQYSAASDADFFNSATVDNNGVLSFGSAKAVTAASTITSWTTNGIDTFDGGSATVVSANDVTVPVVTSNDEIQVAKAGTAVDVAKAGTAKTFATGSVASDGEGDAILTGLGTAVTDSAIKTLGTATEIDALTSVDVAAPTVTIASGATGDVSFVATVTVGSTNANLNDGAAASNGAHTHDIKVVSE